MPRSGRCTMLAPHSLSPSGLSFRVPHIIVGSVVHCLYGPTSSPAWRWRFCSCSYGALRGKKRSMDACIHTRSDVVLGHAGCGCGLRVLVRVVPLLGQFDSQKTGKMRSTCARGPSIIVRGSGDFRRTTSVGQDFAGWAAKWICEQVKRGAHQAGQTLSGRSQRATGWWGP